MKNMNKLIIGLMLLTVLGLLISGCTKTPKSGFEWQDKGDGTWIKTDLACMEKGIITYTCVSNCYENKEVQLTEGNYNIWNLGYDLSEIFIEQTKTNSGAEVICFAQGCLPTQDDQGKWTAVCPAN